MAEIVSFIDCEEINLRKFGKTKLITYCIHSGYPSIQSIEAVSDSVAEDSGTPVRHRGQEWDNSRSSLQRTPTEGLLHLHL